jgi:hypothetical protein
MLLVCLHATRAMADERYFALAVGYNGAPTPDEEGAVKPLRYADDDALSFYELEHEAGSDALVLTVPDEDTRHRYPWAAEVVRPPTLAEIDLAVSDLNRRMDAAAKAGQVPVFLFFYSGHGSRPQNAEPAFALLDGALSQSALHERVLDRIHAQIVHLIIDACHADAVVRPRDVEAKTVDVTQAELMAHLSAATSTRYPNVGLVLASDAGNATDEWDLYQSGVFTHEVISGLRGAADINHDGRVEYSELGAFLTAANREVLDNRARMQNIIRPPVSRTRAALIELGGHASIGWLTDIPSSAGQFFVEDQAGNRIVDVHAEFGFSMSVAIPPGRLLFVHDGELEAELLVARGVHRRFDSLPFHRRPLRTRGAIESALEKGLFLMPFGPGYYGGYVDSRDVGGVVPPPSSENSVAQVTVSDPVRSKPGILVWSLRGASGALVASSLTFGALAWSARSEFGAAPTQVAASQANDRFKLDSTLAWTFLGSAVVCAAVSYLVDDRR